MRAAHLLPGLAVIAVIATAAHLVRDVPATAWAHLFAPGWARDIHAAVLAEAVLPRIAVALLAGAALALSGVLMQAVMNNVLVEPTTLGVSTGASLALGIATLWAPSLLSSQRDLMALGGAAVTALLVVLLGWRNATSPVWLVLAGLLVNLWFGALAAALALFHHDALQGLFAWSSGSLNQNDWTITCALVVRVALAWALSFLILRPLTALRLDDQAARSLGVALHTARLAAMALAVALGAAAVSAVGVIGFIGLAAPALAWLTGARTIAQRIVRAPLLGALMLLATDQVVTFAASPDLPAGSATALLGAPALLLLLPRLAHRTPPMLTGERLRRLRAQWAPAIILAVLLISLAWPMLATGRNASGWDWAAGEAFGRLAPWRVPRFAAAVAAGGLLGLSGSLLQLLTGNRMASPESLGLSSGALLGVIAVVYGVAAPSDGLQMAAAALGAASFMALLFVFASAAAFSPDRVLLAGATLTMAVSGLVSFILAGGTPRLHLLLAWMTGSTYRVTASQSVMVAAFTLIGLAVAPMSARWLGLLPLGDDVARSSGLDVRRARRLLFALAALLSALPTMIVGPLSFVGLMAPHMLRSLGVQRPLALCFGAAVLGALLMACADWLGRNLLFPYQVPAGLLATLIGAPYFIVLMRRRPF